MRLLAEILDWKFLGTFWRFYFQSSESLMRKVLKNPPWLVAKDGVTSIIFLILCNISLNFWQQESHFNEAELQKLEIGAANGIGTARSMAKLLCLFSSGKIVSHKTLEIFRKPIFVRHFDTVLNMYRTTGYGFEYSKSNTVRIQENFGYFSHKNAILLAFWFSDILKEEYNMLGHSGYGGQNAKVDLDKSLSLVYFRNGLSHLIGDLNWSYKNLKNAVYESVLW